MLNTGSLTHLRGTNSLRGLACLQASCHYFTAYVPCAGHRQRRQMFVAFEKTTALITTGIYAYIRHPLYSSLLLLAWGIYFKAPSLPGVLLAVVTTTFLSATARADEGECIQFFGTEYQDYMQKTKRFIPFLF